MSLDGLSSVLTTLVREGVDRFEITGGGEPTLHPALSTIVKNVRQCGASRIKLYTNGVRLIEGLDIDQLNISRVSLNEDKNDAIMRFVGRHRTTSEIVHRARQWGYKEIRLSVPLIRGGVDSEVEAKKLVNAAQGLVDGVVFRPLYPATPDREAVLPNLDVSEWEGVIAALAADCDPAFEIEFDSHGCFRSLQTILASDLSVYSDWSLSNRVFP
jgi:MoaA/NifB/PqqE/SkfB family radical SAM enzyme